MAIHFSLDFTAPFGIGELVFARHSPQQIPNTGGTAWLPYQQRTIAHIKLVLAEYALVITQPMDKKTLLVTQMIYTIIGSPSDHQQAAFIVECSTDPDSEPMMFASGEEIKAYVEPVT